MVIDDLRAMAALARRLMMALLSRFTLLPGRVSEMSPALVEAPNYGAQGNAQGISQGAAQGDSNADAHRGAHADAHGDAHALGSCGVALVVASKSLESDI